MKNTIKKASVSKSRYGGIKYLIGIDEVGRGPLAGPVTVCACLIPADPAFMKEIKSSSRKSGIRPLADSKGLSEKDREAWNAVIRARAKFHADAGGQGECGGAGNHASHDGRILFSIKSAAAKLIDQKGIAVCIRSLIKKCLTELLKKHGVDPSECIVLLDGGLKAPAEFINQETHIRGDAKFPVISFASILAKVHRDDFMKKISRVSTVRGSTYSRYGFASHKGYGTSAHAKAIRAYGLTDQHRKSFCRNILAC